MSDCSPANRERELGLDRRETPKKSTGIFCRLFRGIDEAQLQWIHFELKLYKFLLV